MRIEIKGRHTEITDELREHVEKRFRRIGRQVSEEVRLEVVLREEQNPANPEPMIAEATLHLKGKTLHAGESSPDMLHSIKALGEDMRRQVKRHRERSRKRSLTRRAVGRMRGRAAA